ncbi:cation/calcium exchanger 2-like [Neltuma alba]|uniref:cation/calcium exchanger 2-like n=1 Tax=Neltuma alba TaxID=207710 RepID=UPI0010A4DC34|nr:cation/calcium exchanger 2-like [Prosopis alba]XP_028790105.1 cation/calcium exchanger 2-like [Prosopis alba]
MGTVVPVSNRVGYVLFLNVSFLLLACVFGIIHVHSTEPVVLSHRAVSFRGGTAGTQQVCHDFVRLDDYKAKCLYLQSNNPCVSQGYIDYLYLFYCKFGRFPLLGHVLLFLWLLVLFYLLADTASEYFCPSLENLSKSLKLSPTIAGVTLLSLGNGATDVFASLVSFKSSGTSDIGFNAVLGGASFVSCVVAGVVSISVRHRRIQVKKSAFIRDVCFLLLVLLCLFTILISGQINVLGAICFCSMYIAYAVFVYISSTRWKDICGDAERDSSDSDCYSSDLTVPILSGTEKGLIESVEEGSREDCPEIKKNCCCMRSPICLASFSVLKMPLYLPRRLTIPVVCEERWSKPIAISSVVLAPLLLSALWIFCEGDTTINKSLAIYGIGLLIGIILGITVFFTTEQSSPPKKYLFLWLAGGFVMSVTWSYISAQELVALLVSLGYICGISPSMLGLTVLAWGNSISDLMTNLTVALHDGPEGAQIAISGCYAGPIFNTLVGLGLSLVSSTWSEYPSSVEISRDPYLLETLAFLVAGLAWALVALTTRDMRLDGVVGGGLLAIYFISVFLRLIQTLGPLQYPDT